MKPDILYLDNAATSWPKPASLIETMRRYYDTVGASPGRSGHRLAQEAARIVYGTREAVATLIGAPDPLQVVFTQNATMALNMALQGLLREGDHVLCTGMEHNAVMRPLQQLAARGVSFTALPCGGDGCLDPGSIRELVTNRTRMLVMVHASNVTGGIMPVADAAAVAAEFGLLVCVDAAQTAGAVPIDVTAMGVDLLAFTGHKGLYGPQGTGGLYIRPGLGENMTTILQGGTGSLSEQETQPAFLPDRFEPGTQNAVGLAGLGESVRFVLGTGITAIGEKERSLSGAFWDACSTIHGVRVIGPVRSAESTGIVSLVVDGKSSSDVAQELDERYGIMTRPGLHCAPRAHRTLGTFPDGTVRFSFGYFNTGEDALGAARAVEAIAGA